MAKNPFVDGITNLAIPDSSYGVFLAHHKVLGDLFGIEAVIGNYADFHAMTVGGSVNLRGAQVQNTLDLCNMRVVGDFQLSDVTVLYEANLGELRVGGTAHLNEMQVGRNLYLRGARVKGDALLNGIQVKDRAILISMKVGNVADLSGTSVGWRAYMDSAYLNSLKAGTETPLTVRWLSIDGLIVNQFEGRIAAETIKGKPKRIPRSMQEALEKAPQLYQEIKAQGAAAPGP